MSKPKNTWIAFLEQVEEMRALQSAYFDKSTPAKDKRSILAKSKLAEANVDQTVKELKDTAKKKKLI